MRFLIQDTKHFQFAKELLWVGVITLITVIIWIIYGIYVAFSTPTIDEDVSALFTPLNPTLDQDTLNGLENRFIPPEDFVVVVIPPTPTPASIRLNSASVATTSATP